MSVLRKILSNTVFHIVSFISCLAVVIFEYHRRKDLLATFNSVYAVAYVMFAVALAIFLAAYFDKKADSKTMFKESLSGYFFMISFFAIIFILRG